MFTIAAGIVLAFILIATMKYWLPVLGFLLGLGALILAIALVAA